MTEVSVLRIQQVWGFVIYLLSVSVPSKCEEYAKSAIKCGVQGRNLKYVWGDALTDPANCMGPHDIPYPAASIARMFRKNSSTSPRSGRTYNTLDPSMTQQLLLQNYNNNAINLTSTFHEGTLSRMRRDFNHKDLCQTNVPSRLCKTRYNTTAPMYGVSLTSGQPVTIVQKFPDLLQQVIYEVCESSECDLVRGECTQTYIPYLFLVIPLGPVTLTGQDYVLVESGCVCKPKYFFNSISDNMSALPSL